MISFGLGDTEATKDSAVEVRSVPLGCGLPAISPAVERDDDDEFAELPGVRTGVGSIQMRKGQAASPAPGPDLPVCARSLCLSATLGEVSLSLITGPIANEAMKVFQPLRQAATAIAGV